MSARTTVLLLPPRRMRWAAATMMLVLMTASRCVCRPGKKRPLVQRRRYRLASAQQTSGAVAHRPPSGSLAHLLTTASGDEKFSLLEISDPGATSRAEEIAERFPQATIVALGWPSAMSQGRTLPNNLYMLQSASEGRDSQIQRLHDSPTVFTHVLALGLSPENFANQSGPLLLGVARTLIMTTGAGPQTLQGAVGSAGAIIVAAAARAGVQVAEVHQAGQGLLQVVVGGFSRAVRHHFGDNRKCPTRGYWLSYQAGPSSHPQLQRLKHGQMATAEKKGLKTQEAFGCVYTNQLKGPHLSQQSWVNLFTLSGLGLPSSATPGLHRRLLQLVLDLPHFEDGTPWNACVDGPGLVWCDMDYGGSGQRIRDEALAGRCTGGEDWQEQKAPACILDMMLIAITGCGQVEFAQLRDAWFGDTDNSGRHPKGRPISQQQMAMCRDKHLGAT